MHNGDYPGQAFFGVYKGRHQRVEATYNQLLENIQNYPGAVYEAFMNRAHAMHFSKTGQILPGATPIKPGASRTVPSPAAVSRTTSVPVLSKTVPLEVKPKAVSLSAAMEKKPLGSVALGKTGESSRSSASGNKPSTLGNKPSTSGSKPSGSGFRPAGSNLAAAIHRGTPTPVGNKSTSINQVRNANTAAGSTSREVKVWTDGSCLGNGKKDAAAAYAVYFGPGDSRNEAKRVPGPQTNNVGEIYAVIRALEIVDEGVKHMTIYTDSQYTINSLGWLPNWIKRGGMTASNKPAANYGMIKYMDALIKRRGERLNLVHVRGHQDDEGNNAADLMARNAAKDPTVPPSRDWHLECVNLQKKPAVTVTGSPKITAVGPAPVKQEPDDESDYDSEYSDLDLDDPAIDDVDPPLSRYPSDYSVTSAEVEKPAAGKKRARDEPNEEVPDSENERKAAGKRAKEQGIKCPNCKHKFNVTLRK